MNYLNIILGIWAAVATGISIWLKIANYKLIRKYKKPVILIDLMPLENDTFRKSMGISCSIEIRIKNDGEKPVTIDHPLKISVSKYFWIFKFVLNFIIVNYLHSGGGIPQELKPHNKFIFSVSFKDLVDRHLTESDIRGKLKLNVVIRDTFDREYHASKPLHGKFKQGRLELRKNKVIYKDTVSI